MHVRKDKERGQELVEFAIAIPLLLIVMFGVLELGRAFYVAITIANAAREGARYGGLNRDEVSLITSAPCNPATNYASATPSILNVTCREAQNTGLDISQMTVTTCCPLECGYPPCPVECPTASNYCDAYENLVVRVDYNFELLMQNVFNTPSIPIARFARMMIQ